MTHACHSIGLLRGGQFFLQSSLDIVSASFTSASQATLVRMTAEAGKEEKEERGEFCLAILYRRKKET